MSDILGQNPFYSWFYGVDSLGWLAAFALFVSGLVVAKRRQWKPVVVFLGGSAIAVASSVNLSVCLTALVSYGTGVIWEWMAAITGFGVLACLTAMVYTCWKGNHGWLTRFTQLVGYATLAAVGVALAGETLALSDPLNEMGVDLTTQFSNWGTDIAFVGCTLLVILAVALLVRKGYAKIKHKGASETLFADNAQGTIPVMFSADSANVTLGDNTPGDGIRRR